MQWLFKRKLLITLLVLASVFFLISATGVFAAEPRPADAGKFAFTGCGYSVSGAALGKIGVGSGSGFHLGQCVASIFAWILYLGIWLVSWALWAAAKFFNIILAVQNISFHDQPMVNVGWKIARDVANIFYIFFLLIIAIATIIRYESYGMKQLLWKLIVSALLVNFSLPIAGLVIDFSNALGNTFYINMGIEEDPEIAAGLRDTLNKDGRTGQARDISQKLVSGFQPQNLLNNSAARLQAGGAVEATGNVLNLLMDIILAELLAIFLIAIACIVLIAGMILLIVRIVVLWFVLILAPFAFLFWVLPRTSNLSGQWFETLFKHAFFYPAFMFPLYLVLTAIDHGVISQMIGADQTHLDLMFADTTFGSVGSLFVQKIQLILNFVMLGIFMVAGLFVAQRMSVEGAGAAMKVSKSLGDWGRQRAGRIANAPVAAVSDKVLSTKVGQQVSRILPGSRRVAALSLQKRSADRAQEAERQATRVKNLAPPAAAAMLGTMNARGKAKAFETMDEKQKARVIQQMNAPQRVQFAKTINATDPTKDYKRQVAIATGNIEQAMQILHDQPPQEEVRKDPAKAAEYQKLVDKYVKGLSEKDLAKMGKETVENDVFFRRALANNDTNINVNKLKDSREFVDDKVRDAYTELSKTINSVSGALKILGVEEPPAGADDATKDKYRQQMTDYIATVKDYNMDAIDANTIRNNEYFQEIMLKNMNTNDIRRLASSKDGAQAVSDGFKGVLQRNYSIDMETDWSGALTQIKNVNQNLGRSLETNPGFRAVIQEGRRATKRDLLTSQQQQQPGAPPPPAPPPPATP